MIDERPIVFDIAGERGVGVIATPAGNTSPPLGVLIVVGGPQYRAGSHRQFTKMARVLAAAGHASLRFDVRGMGDATGEQRSFESLDDDIAAALDAAGRHLPGVARWVVFGLCDGASAALMYLAGRTDARVHGLCLANPWVRSDESLARTHVQHYYLRRLMQPGFWRKLASGGVGVGAVAELAGKLRTTLAPRAGGSAAAGQAGAPRDFRQRMADGMARFTGPTLILLSGDDFTAREFADLAGRDERWQSLLQRPSCRREDIDGADHTFSTSASEIRLHGAIASWLRGCVGDVRPPMTRMPSRRAPSP